MGYLCSANEKDVEKWIEHYISMLHHKDNSRNRCLLRETHLTCLRHLFVRCDTLASGWAHGLPLLIKGTQA